ncbi:MAG TPA: DUF4336 domain-containing protein [Acetobacteraceae bacterium]|nr:DUF4336 domain-containing protein [Acetobacteraceae bacterium]
MPEDRATYPPLDILKPVAEGIWIADSGPLHILGMPLPVRMTVVRLGDGGMWLHSPTRYTEGLRQAIEGLGPIRHLIAPNVAHWSFLKDWQRHCPKAVTWAAPNLRRRRQVRKAELRLDHDLSDTSPPDWAGEIAQAVVPGGGGFSEVGFFHQNSRTLVLTDLIQNLEPEKVPLLVRPIGNLLGVRAPNGKAPIYLRLVILARRRDAAQAASRMVAWAPERVIFAHGTWFERDGTAALRRSLSWLLPRPG